MNKILMYIFLLVSTIYLLSCVENGNEDDFNLICEYFDSLYQDQAASKDSDPDYKFKFINDRIKANIPSDHVSVYIWNTVLKVEPVKMRYLIFKEGADETLKKSWDCKSMERLLKDI